MKTIVVIFSGLKMLWKLRRQKCQFCYMQAWLDRQVIAGRITPDQHEQFTHWIEDAHTRASKKQNRCN